jgi:WD40 repeat protein
VPSDGDNIGVDTLQERPLLAFFWSAVHKVLIMALILRHLPPLLAGIIFFSNLSFAACTGSSRQTSLAGYALSPDNSRVAAIAKDGALFWWDVASGKRTQLMECVKPQVFDHPILFSPDSSRLAVSVDSAVHVFDISTGRVIAQLTSLKLTEIHKMAFSDDGQRLAVSYREGAVVWEIASQVEIAAISAHPSLEALALNRDGTLLALGCRDGLETWRVVAGGAARRLAKGFEVESVLFAHEDQWIVGLTATALPSEPRQRLRKYKREIAVWDSATGEKLKGFKADAELNELRFGLASGGPHLLLATDFEGRLRAWDLDTGELKAIWKTSSGHPSADGTLLLREGDAPGRLELWTIGSPDEKARAFTYKSPLCAETFVDNEGNVKFEPLFIGDGFSDNDQPFGSLTTYGYVAQDCTRLNVTRLTFGTEARARQELEQKIAQAIEVLEKGPPKDNWWQVFLGERRVIRLPRGGYALGPFAVISLEGTSLIEIDSSSLPVALAMEKQMLERK